MCRKLISCQSLPALCRGWGFVLLAFVACQVLADQGAYQDRKILIPKLSQPKPPVRTVATQTSPAPQRTAVPSQSAAPRSARPSLVRQAAHAEVIEEAPPKLVKRAVVRGESPDHDGTVMQVSYGCECGGCVGEPSCGHEVAYEVGCGAESCSVSGCEGSCDPACGSEGYVEASCGLETYGAGGCDACGVSSCNGACGVMRSTDSYNFCLPILRIEWCRFDFFAGVNGFTGPANYANTAPASATAPQDYRMGSSSFGFYEGLNEGRSLKWLCGLDLASQMGVRATQSSLSGTEFTDDTRNQVFVTAGLFRRVDLGLQYGLVVDYLNDDWWFQNDLLQLRGELSWNDGCAREFGYQFMAGVDDSTSDTSVINAAGNRFRSTVSFEPTDQHRFFFRGTTGGGGQYMAFVGGTDQSDGLLGISMTTAMRRGFAFQAGSTYLIPNEGRRNGGNENESWNMSMGIIYRPGGLRPSMRYIRPMFDVADNGTFMVDRL